ncbi:MAG: hypothetical protein V7L01_00870 [Nostoc sp.]|uniref:hypothetical protein n=1 Tax=Nostoc sp. TaxID=1180 RepID=UPI002FF8E0E0
MSNRIGLSLAFCHLSLLMTLRVTLLRRYRFANASYSWGKPPRPYWLTKGYIVKLRF